MSYTGALTVSQVNTYLKAVLENDSVLRSVYICGEISNFTNHYRTGHFYFTLKDENAQIKCVMFRSSASRLRFSPENGMQVIIHGRVSLYERDGQYQLYADGMQPDGTGALHLAYEQLKKKLEQRGWFDPDLKKPIPRYPMRIGVVTSPTGAAVRDILQILSRRFPLSQVVLCPVQVQGESASGEISAAIYDLNKADACDVIIVGRGGGSIEELWAFNEENVAKAVYESLIPVISAVGHETDYTICDFVADLRAPTPSAAAELAVPDRAEQTAYLSSVNRRMSSCIQSRIDSGRARIKELSSRGVMSSPLSLLDQRRMLLDSIINKISASSERMLTAKKMKFYAMCGKLDTLSPLRVLSRGYSILMQGDEIIKDIDSVGVQAEITARLHGGFIKCTVNEVIKSGGSEKDEKADI